MVQGLTVFVCFIHTLCGTWFQLNFFSVPRLCGTGFNCCCFFVHRLCGTGFWFYTHTVWYMVPVEFFVLSPGYVVQGFGFIHTLCGTWFQLNFLFCPQAMWYRVLVLYTHCVVHGSS